MQEFSSDFLWNFSKFEQLYILTLILQIQDDFTTLVIECESFFDKSETKFDPSDTERYLKMAMKIDPNDPKVLHRRDSKQFRQKKSRTRTWRWQTADTPVHRSVTVVHYVVLHSSLLSLQSYGSFLQQKQFLRKCPRSEVDYSYIEYYRKSADKRSDFSLRLGQLHQVKYCEVERDYFTGSLRQINHLIQIDEKPNLELKEPQWEIYKISISSISKNISYIAYII